MVIEIIDDFIEEEGETEVHKAIVVGYDAESDVLHVKFEDDSDGEEDNEPIPLPFLAPMLRWFPKQ